MKPKILIISMAYFPRFVGGAEVAIKELTDRLSDQFDFHMVTLRYDSTLPRISREGSVLVHRIGLSLKAPTIADLRKPFFRVLKIWFQIAAYLHARALNRQYSYQLVWGMMAHSAGVPAGLFKRFNPTVPYLLTLQEGDPPAHIERQMRIFGPLFEAAFTRSDHVQVISNFLGGWARGMGAKQVSVVPNGVDLSRFGTDSAGAKRRVLREKIGVRDGETLLFTTSRLVPKNGVDLVISALTDLPERVRFAIAGDGPEREHLHALAEVRGVSSRIIFLGEVSQDNLPEYLAAADIFIRASRSEGQGIAFIEAMASGLPTIGTNVGGIPDFIRDGETGFLAEPSVGSVAVTIRRVIEQGVEANHAAQEGTRLVKERYGWERIAEEMRALFNNLL